MKISLHEIAYARSGDKGSHVNIGLIAFTPQGYDLLQKKITAEKVKEHFISLKPKDVLRYELPNLIAFNFMLKGVLQGGASQCLRLDSQGKSAAQALLNLEIELTDEELKSAGRDTNG